MRDKELVSPMLTALTGEEVPAVFTSEAKF